MFIEKLILENFRNISYLSMDFSPRYNILTGENAQGKTNTLEAISLCLRGKSHREKNNENFIKKNCEKASIYAKIKKDDLSNFEIGVEIKDKRETFLDLEKIKKREVLLKNVSAVLFTPEDLKIVKEGPNYRRSFLDECVSLVYPVYYTTLKEYEKILKQRNALLKKETSKKELYSLLDVYDKSLVSLGSSIIKKRIATLKQMELFTNEIHSKLAKDEIIKFNYFSNVIRTSFDARNVEKSYEEALRKSRFLDLERRTTLIGVHLDDIHIFLNGENAKSFASQGQQRSISLSMKLSLIPYLKEKEDEYPIVLLDDVMSELDHIRQKQIISLLKDTQSFITCVSHEFIEENKDMADTLIIRVNNGSLVKEETGGENGKQ